ncbi:hypothetical protein C8R32_103241 [Nitrosospira sp. Nsp5]|uniref:Uncharacterized protein n=1 Tax=Nitrosospira multiformis TaxID=1231 RepID=A0ABY0T5H8_9PROT|nr:MULTISPECIES: hypothetical protein [Nitrosospira]PTR09622.1 hypothetical protein C8R32_103241 [Nitrosospira sp. Nsp5]SDQ25974.1 hypothetical protein SAMN05216402_0058 [Nitrosospira multiformis]
MASKQIEDDLSEITIKGKRMHPKRKHADPSAELKMSGQLPNLSLCYDVPHNVTEIATAGICPDDEFHHPELDSESSPNKFALQRLRRMGKAA